MATRDETWEAAVAWFRQHFPDSGKELEACQAEAREAWDKATSGTSDVGRLGGSARLALIQGAFDPKPKEEGDAAAG